MRVILDTNVLVSAIVFKSKTINNTLECILCDHKLVLPSCVVDELKQVITRKFADRLKDLDEFLTALPYEYVYTPDVMKKDLFVIRDSLDYPVLYTAIIEDVDILVTGDKDFFEVEVEKPEILSPADFLAKYSRRNC